MRLALAALAAILVAAPADAARVLVVRQHGLASGQGEAGAVRQIGHITNVLDGLGVDYDVVTQNVVAQNALTLKTGTAVFGAGDNALTRNYGAIIHVGYSAGSQSTKISGYAPDSLTLAAGWPSIPHIFLGSTRVSGGSIWSNSAACSTGAKGTVTSPTLAGMTHALQAVGTDYRWKSTGHVYHLNTANSFLLDRTTPGILRSRVIVGGSSAGFNDNGLTGSAPWPDSMSTPSGYTSTPLADTAVIWTRERSSAETAPLIFALPIYASNGGATEPHALVAMAVAIADSAASGTIIGQKEGWEPIKIAFAVSGAFTRSESDVNPAAWTSHGTQPSDTAFVKAGIDSLESLKVPVLVSVNLDSVASYPSEKEWWTRLTQARFVPESRVGTGGDLTNANAFAGRHLAPDVFGFKRTRKLIHTARYDSGASSVNFPCDGTDTTLSCILFYARNRLDSIPEFKGKLGRTLIAPESDLIPSGFTRASMPVEDSLVMAMKRSGFTGVVFHPMNVESRPSSSWYRYSGGDGTPATYQPSSRNARQRKHIVPNHGEFRYLQARFIDESAATLATTHDFANEFLVGAFSPLWYTPDLSYWVHEFRTPLSVFLVRPGALGFKQTSTSNVNRIGYHHIRWIVHQGRTINHFAGRTIVRFVHADDITP